MTPTVYRCFDAEGDLLYVGCSMQFTQRLAVHQGAQRPWWSDLSRIEVEHFDSKVEAVRAEAIAIRDEHPRFNRVIPRTKCKQCAASLADSIRTTYCSDFCQAKAMRERLLQRKTAA